MNKMNIMTAKEILIEELNEDMHPEKVEDVIFWALEYYVKHRRKGTWGETIAYAIVERIKEAESLGDLSRQDKNKN